MSERAAGRRSTLWEVLTATRWRVAWGYLGAVLLIVLARPVPTSILVGLPLVIAGESIRILANGSLIKDKALTNFGIYAHIRHPLYVGSALIGAGFLIMARSPYLVAVFILLFLALYRRTIATEERKMDRLFGEAYHEWAVVTPRFVPRRLAVGEIRSFFTFRKAWVNREHQGLLGVAALIAVLYLRYLLFG